MIFYSFDTYIVRYFNFSMLERLISTDHFQKKKKTTGSVIISSSFYRSEKAQER